MQNKNDTIYRQDAINALWKALYEYEDKTEKQFIESDELDVGDWIIHRVFVQNMSDIDRQTILNLPPAEPEQKKGKWIDNGLYSDNFPHHAWLCSECGEGVIEIDTPWYKFCPNCGADMRGEQE